MNTYLIVSGNGKFIEKKIESIKSEFFVEEFNFHRLYPENSIGIEEIRKIRSLFTLKPFAGGSRLVVIYQFDRATTEAQNALLKTLEEPPVNNYIALVAENADKVLPTIQSRCRMIKEPPGKTCLKSVKSEKFDGIVGDILQATSGERINISIKYAKNREETLLLFTTLTNYLETLLYEKKPDLDFSNIDISRTIDKIIKAKSLIEGNINYKAVADLLLLSFPQKRKNF